jgi:hypothetical protein
VAGSRFREERGDGGELIDIEAGPDGGCGRCGGQHRLRSTLATACRAVARSWDDPR